jgi:hypothetical protein
MGGTMKKYNLVFGAGSLALVASPIMVVSCSQNEPKYSSYKINQLAMQFLKGSKTCDFLNMQRKNYSSIQDLNNNADKISNKLKSFIVKNDNFSNEFITFLDSKGIDEMDFYPGEVSIKINTFASDTDVSIKREIKLAYKINGQNQTNDFKEIKSNLDF